VYEKGRVRGGWGKGLGEKISMEHQIKAIGDWFMAFFENCAWRISHKSDKLLTPSFLLMIENIREGHN